MLEIMLNINSEDYDYNMINHVYKTLSEKITDVKLDFERSKFDKSKISTQIGRASCRERV